MPQSIINEDNDFNVCWSLINTFRSLDLFKETLSNRVVKVFQAGRLRILLREGPKGADTYWRSVRGE